MHPLDSAKGVLKSDLTHQLARRGIAKMIDHRLSSASANNPMPPVGCSIYVFRGDFADQCSQA